MSICEECDGEGVTIQGWTDKSGEAEDQYGFCASCSPLARKKWRLDVTLTDDERESLALTIGDAFTPYGIDADRWSADDAGRLLEARIETLIRRRLEPLAALAESLRRDSLSTPDCPDGLCGSCSIGNAATLIEIAIDDFGVSDTCARCGWSPDMRVAYCCHTDPCTLCDPVHAE